MSLLAALMWIDRTVIPTNVAIARQVITSIEEDYSATGEYVKSIAQTDAKNCWGQPIKILVVKVGWPSNAIDVTVISPGPLGMIGNASITKIVGVK